MSEEPAEVQVGCRSCHREMPVDAKQCPHCGARVIGTYESLALAGAGLVIAIATGLVGLWPVTVLGLLALVAGVAFYHNRSRKLEEATN